MFRLWNVGYECDLRPYLKIVIYNGQSLALSCFAHSFCSKIFEGKIWQIKQQPSPTERKTDCKALEFSNNSVQKKDGFCFSLQEQNRYNALIYS